MAEKARGLTVLFATNFLSLSRARLVSPLPFGNYRDFRSAPQKEGQKRAKTDKKNNPVSNLLV